MLARLSRFGLALPRSLAVPPARFVSQSKASSATASTAVTELHRPGEQAGHGEVSPYVKVSLAATSPAFIDRLTGQMAGNGHVCFDLSGLTTDPVYCVKMDSDSSHLNSKTLSH